MSIDGRIRINCKKVYDNGVSYLNCCDELRQIQTDLDNIAGNIQTAWKGVDCHNFIVSYENHIKDIDTLIDFLVQNGELLKKNALNHSGIDNSFAAKMERSDINGF